MKAFMPWSPCSETREASAMRSPHTVTREIAGVAMKTQHRQKLDKFKKKSKDIKKGRREGGRQVGDKNLLESCFGGKLRQKSRFH